MARKSVKKTKELEEELIELSKETEESIKLGEEEETEKLTEPGEGEEESTESEEPSEIQPLEINAELVAKEIIDAQLEVDKKAVEIDNNEYEVVLATPAFYVVKLDNGALKTVQRFNRYQRGEMAKL